MKRLIFLSGFLSIGSFLLGEEKQSFERNYLDGVRCYHHEPITSKNIVSLIGAVPDDMLTVVASFLAAQPPHSHLFKHDFFKNEQYLQQLLLPLSAQMLVDYVATQNSGSGSSGLKNNLENLNKLHEAIGLVKSAKLRDDELALSIMATSNLARNNYVFHCPGSDKWLIKIASPGNRMVNLFTSAGFNVYTKKLMEDRELNIEAFKNKATCQTISFAQISLMLRDLIDTNGLKHICAPRTYLYQIANNQEGQGVHDENTFVVQEFVPSLVHLYQRPDLIADHKLITVDMVQELKTAIKHAALWNLKHNLAICLDEHSPHYKKLVLFDTEQRNLTSPEEFTYVYPKLYRKIAAVGLREVCELFESRTDLVEVLRS